MKHPLNMSIRLKLLRTIFYSSVGLAVFVVSAPTAAAFFFDREQSSGNHWQGAVVDIELSAAASPLVTPTSLTVGKHPESLDLWYRFSITPAGSGPACDDVTLTVQGPAGTTTAAAKEFPPLPATTLGEWSVAATRTGSEARADCELLVAVHAWAAATPEVGFSDREEVLVEVSGQAARVQPATLGSSPQAVGPLMLSDRTMQETPASEETTTQNQPTKERTAPPASPNTAPDEHTTVTSDDEQGEQDGQIEQSDPVDPTHESSSDDGATAVPSASGEDNPPAEEPAGAATPPAAEETPAPPPTDVPKETQETTEEEAPLDSGADTDPTAAPSEVSATKPEEEGDTTAADDEDV